MSLKSLVFLLKWTGIQVTKQEVALPTFHGGAWTRHIQLVILGSLRVYTLWLSGYAEAI